VGDEGFLLEMISYAILDNPPASEKPKRTQMPVRRSEFNYMQSYMKSLSSVSIRRVSPFTQL